MLVYGEVDGGIEAAGFAGAFAAVGRVIGVWQLEVKLMFAFGTFECVDGH